jgi:hypothetical protein
MAKIQHLSVYKNGQNIVIAKSFTAISHHIRYILAPLLAPPESPRSGGKKRINF